MSDLPGRPGPLVRTPPLPGTWPPRTTGTWPRVRSEISEFRQAAIASFNAMRSDLADLRTEMRTGFTEVRGQLDGASAGLEQITGLLNTLIAQQGDQPGETS